MPIIGNTPRPGYVYDQETDTWIPIGVGPHTHDYVDKTLIDAKGDLLVGSAADTVSKLSVSENGSTLVADSSASTGLRWQAPVSVNPVINGGFDIWQRGTSVPFGTVGGYGADRYIIVRTGWAGGATMSRQTGTAGIQYAARVQRDSGNTSTASIGIVQSFETANSLPFQGKTVTFSFYARAGANYSAASNGLIAELLTGTGTDQNAVTVGYTGYAVPISQVPTLTTSWQRFQYTGTIASNANEMGVGFSYVPVGTAGANDWFEVTGIQIEVGSVATPFRRSGGTLAGELAACQRYYFRTTNDSSFARFAFGSCETTTAGVVQFMLPVQMRVAPTAVEWSNLRTTDLANDYGAPSSVTINTFLNTRNIAVFNVADTGWTAYRPLYLEANNNAAAHLAVTAEL